MTIWAIENMDVIDGATPMLAVLFSGYTSVTSASMQVYYNKADVTADVTVYTARCSIVENTVYCPAVDTSGYGGRKLVVVVTANVDGISEVRQVLITVKKKGSL
jgi:hypothetical protein